MGFFSKFLTGITSFPRAFFSDFLPAHENILTKEELEKAIKTDEAVIAARHPIPKNFNSVSERGLAFVIFGLAVNYYRKALHYSSLDEEDINRAITSAHQIESFFTKEKFPFQWEQLQEILAMMYFARGYGARAENLKFSIFYLENWLEVLKDVETRLSVHSRLIFAYAGAIEEDAEKRKRKIEEHYVKAAALAAHFPEWIAQLNYLKTCANIFADRKYYDIPSPNEKDRLFELAELLTGHNSQPVSYRFDTSHFPLALNKFHQIFEEALIDATKFLTGDEISELSFLLEQKDYSYFMERIDISMPEKFRLILDDIEIIIRQYISFVEQLPLEEARENFNKSEGEVFISSLYIFKAGLCQHPEETEENYKKAEFYFERSREHKSAYLQRPFHLLWEGKYFATFIYFLRDKWTEAGDVYKKSLEILETNYKISAGKGGKDTTLSLLKTRNSLLSLNYAFVLAKLGNLREAVVLLEKWRGRELNERLNINSHMLDKVRSPDLETYWELRNEINQLTVEMQNRTADEYIVSAKKLREKQNQLENLVARIRNYLPSFLLEFNFTMIQNAARQKKPLVYLFGTIKGSSILIITADGKVKSLFFEEFTSLKAEDLFDELKAGLEKSKFGRVDGGKEFVSVLEKLGSYFIQTLISELQLVEADSVCLIPCGVLSQFPWHAAPTPEGQVLLDFFDVSYTPTAKFLFDSQQRLKQKVKPEKFVGIADPTGNLKYASKEVENITGLWKTAEIDTLTLANEKASKKAIRDSAPFDIIHFACHGTFNASTPLESALILGNNEKLTLSEILEKEDFRHLAQSRLVVLSACQTALVDVNEKPEENVGLPLGFMSRGVPGVIGTLWSVNDKSSAILMTKFYEIWLEKGIFEDFSPSIALREAQNWLRTASKEDIQMLDRLSTYNEREFLNREAKVEMENETKVSEMFENPYFWAGFVFIGI